VIRIYIIVLQLCLLSLSTIATADIIRFASIDYCPFTCDPLKEGGKEGVMVDVVRVAFEEAGYEIQIEIMPYVRAVRAVNEGKYDGIMVVGKKYAPELVYPRIPTLTQRMMFIVKPHHRWRYTDYSSLLSIDIAMVVVKGFDYADVNINKLVAAKHHNLVALHGLKTTERGLELLNIERVDTYVEGELTALYQIDKYGYGENFIVAGFSARDFDSYTAFSPNSLHALKYAQLLSEKIFELQQSGELNTILQKYNITTDLGLGHLIGEKKAER
jgi:polar amino acid transport system substrate-binding protein